MANILFLGAHTDDIEIGAGASLLKLLKDYNIRYISFSRCTDLQRNKDILDDQRAVAEFLRERRCSVSMYDFPNKNLFSVSKEIREILEEERDVFDPSIIFTHYKSDIHQDHKVIADESRRVFKNRTLLSYEETPSTPTFVPNFFIPLSSQEIDDKIKLLTLYKTQKDLYYLGENKLRYLAGTRGTQIGKPFAEAFDMVRGIWQQSL